MQHLYNYFVLLFFITGISFSHAVNKVPVNNTAPRFTENKGQWNENVLYRLGLSNAHLYLEQSRFTWVFYDPEFLESIHPHKTAYTPGDKNAFAYHMNFIGANPAAAAGGANPYNDYSNYFTGSDERGWASHVRSYNTVSYDELYPGIDMNIYGKDDLLKYDFIVEKGVSPSQIKMHYEGAEKVYLSGGKLKVVNTFNTVTEHQPVAWQVINGVKKNVACEFVVNNNTVSFSFPSGYDADHELVIDPVLEFSTYTGSTADNWGYSATYDNAGNFYAGGIAFAAGYPVTTGAYQVNFAGGVGGFPTDISLSKFSSDGSSLIYSTYIGGTRNEMPYSMFVNQNNEVFIYGATGSANYPTTSGAYDQTFNGGTNVTVDNVIQFPAGSDIFVTRVSANGASLVASTYVGGTGNDGLNIASPLNYNYSDHARGEIFIDQNGNAVVGSCTFSTNFPTTVGSQQQTNNGGQDGCLFRLNPALTTLQWSTYYGGSNGDAIYSMKINSLGNIFVCGGTASSNLATTSGVLHPTYQGGNLDGFVAAFNPTNGSMVRSSFIGTNLYDQAYFIEIDSDDDVYLYGQSLGSYPVTNGIYSNPGSKQFIHKMNNTFTTTYFSTVFGSGSSSLNLSPTAFLVDVCEKIYVAGWGGTVNTSNGSGTNLGNTNGMPLTNDAYQSTTDGSDFYFMVLESGATSLLYGTYFGGNGVDEHVDGGTSRFDKNGIIYEAVCAGCGGSSMFPTTQGAWSNTNNSTNCNLGAIKFRIQLSTVDVDVTVDNDSTSGCAPFTVNFNSNGVNAQGYIWDFGDGTTSVEVNPTHVYQDEGVYTVMLVGYDSTSCSGLIFLDTAFATITVANADLGLVAGNDTTICSGNMLQLGGLPTSGVVYQWSPATGLSDPNIANPVATPLVATTYVLTGTDTAGGCVNTASVLVNVFGVTAFSDTTICSGGSAQLSVSDSGVSVVWSPAQYLSDPNISAPVATPPVTTVFYVNVTDSTGCSVTDSVTVTVNSLPVADAGPDVQLCLGDTAQLQATGGTAYSWTPSTGLSATNVSDPFAFPLVDTEYIVTVTDVNGCQDSDTVQVTVLSAPTADAGSDVSICRGDTTQLSASGGATYSWLPATNISDASVFNPEVWPDFPTVYVVTVTDQNGCTDSDSVLVDVFAVTTSSDTAICFGDTAQLSVFPVGTSVTWTPATYLSDPNIANPLAFPPITTVYYASVSDGSGCSSIDSVTVIVQAIPVADAGGDVYICEGNGAELNATGGTNYLWSPSTGLSDTTIANPVASPAVTTTYVVIVSDQIGCSNSDTVTVNINPLPPADAGQDVAICTGDTTQLTASGGAFYTWSPSIGLSNPNSANPVANPATTTTYTVLVQGPSGQQVQNPGFESGNTGFSSGYTYSGTTPNSGLYTITTDASLADPSFTGLGHGGSGNFMVVSANFTYGTNIWCQDYDVAPNTDYYFSAWLSTLILDDPALLQLTVNGTPTGSPFTTPPFGVGTWHEFSYVWNSGNNTHITLCIRNITTTTGPTAFGLDDVTFAPYCDNTDQVTVTVNPLPVSDAGPDVSICIGENTQLTATGGNTYSWTPSATLSDPNISDPVATPVLTTTYSVHVTTGAGCEGDDEVTVTVNPLPVANAGIDNELCAGDSVQLNATGGNTYTWTPVTGLSNANIANPSASPGTTTTYTLTVVDQNNCTDDDQVTITVNPLPVADAGPDLDICLGDTAQLNATGGTDYVWTPATGLSNTNIANPLAFPLQPTTYIVNISDANGCEDSDTMSISIFSITTSPGQAICDGDSLQLSVSGGSTFVWTPADGMNNPNIANPNVAPETTTTYTVTATDANGCVAVAQLTVEVLAAPVAGFTAHYIPSCEGIVGEFINGSTGANQYLWIFADGDTSTAENPDHGFNIGPGTVVTLIVYNGEGCVDTATVDFSGNNYSNVEFDLMVPNIITPNSDGLNDCFRPAFEGEFNDCFTLLIYNRWGALIFESIAQGDCWDGTTKAGNPVAAGTYFYLLQVNGLEKAGFLTVAHD